MSYHRLPKQPKTGTRLIFKILNMILKAATLILIAGIICLLASTFGKNCSTYGNPLLITEEKNYILMAYLGTAGVLIFYEIITFFWVLMGRGKQGHNGQNQDTGRGLFSFLFIGVTSFLSYILYSMIPVSPEALEGLQGRPDGVWKSLPEVASDLHHRSDQLPDKKICNTIAHKKRSMENHFSYCVF